jgi:hypothetical protein
VKTTKQAARYNPDPKVIAGCPECQTILFSGEVHPDAYMGCYHQQSGAQGEAGTNDRIDLSKSRSPFPSRRLASMKGTDGQ